MKIASKTPILFASAVALAALTFSCKGGVGDPNAEAFAAYNTQIQSGAELSLLDPSTNNTQLAQSFQVAADIQNVPSVQLGLQANYLNAFGLGNSALRVSIMGDQGGPNSLVVLGSGTYPVSALNSTSQFVKFTFATPISNLSKNTLYWIVLSGNHTWANAHIAWMASDLNPYASGQAMMNVGNLWTNPDGTLWHSADGTTFDDRRDFTFRLGSLN